MLTLAPFLIVVGVVVTLLLAQGMLTCRSVPTPVVSPLLLIVCLRSYGQFGTPDRGMILCGPTRRMWRYLLSQWLLMWVRLGLACPSFYRKGRLQIDLVVSEQRLQCVALKCSAWTTRER